MSEKKTVKNVRTTDAAPKGGVALAPREHFEEKESIGALSTDLFKPEDADGYNEGLDAGAFAIPFLAILQGLSPAVQRGTPDYIEGAQSGQILNTVTRKVQDRLRVSVLRRSHTLVWWIPRDDGGGFVREVDATPELMGWFNAITPDEKNRRYVTEDVPTEKGGTKKQTLEVSEHRNFYVVILGDEKREPGLVSMSRSNLTPARAWNTAIDIDSAKVEVSVPDGTGGFVKAKKPILHSGIWELSTLLKKKDQNNYYVWVVKFIAHHQSRELLAEVREKVNQAKELKAIPRAIEQTLEPTEGPHAEM